jgi:hypothetical protein
LPVIARIAKFSGRRFFGFFGTAVFSHVSCPF